MPGQTRIAYGLLEGWRLVSDDRSGAAAVVGFNTDHTPAMGQFPRNESGAARLSLIPTDCLPETLDTWLRGLVETLFKSGLKISGVDIAAMGCLSEGDYIWSIEIFLGDEAKIEATKELIKQTLGPPMAANTSA